MSELIYQSIHTGSVIDEAVTKVPTLEESINSLVAEGKKYAKFAISADQSIATATYAQIVWGAKTPYNNEDFCEIDSSTGRIKVLKDGMYQIELNVVFAANTTGIRQLWTDNLLNFYPNVSSPCYTTITYFMYLTTGTLLSQQVYQASGVALNILKSGTSCKIRKAA